MVSPKTQAEAPIRSLDQRMEALKRANDIRVRRARLKRDLKDGRVQIDQILSNPPEYVFRSRVDTQAVCESRNQPPYSLYGNVRGVTSLQVCPPSVVRSSKY